MRGVHVDRGTQHMLDWGQRIATRTGVESPSGLALSVMLLRVQNKQFSEEKGFIVRYTEKEV